jgi:hypothetical protein
MMITRCAMTLLVLGLLVLPFETQSPVALTVNLCGIAVNLGILVLVFVVTRRDLRRQGLQVRAHAASGADLVGRGIREGGGRVGDN